MIATQPSPTAGEIRERAHEILTRAEFGRHESLVERFFNWLRDLFGGFDFGVGSGSGLLGNVIALLLLGAAAYALVRLAVAIAGRPLRRTRRATDDLGIELEPGRPAADWASEAERLEAEGAWREAMRARYRELVRVLVEAGVLDDVPGRTTGEYCRAFVAVRPDAAPAFVGLTEIFEEVWYGGRAADASDLQRFRTLAAQARAAVPATA